MDTRLIILDLETCRGQGDILAPSRVIAFVLKMGMGPVGLFSQKMRILIFLTFVQQETCPSAPHTKLMYCFQYSILSDVQSSLI